MMKQRLSQHHDMLADLLLNKAMHRRLSFSHHGRTSGRGSAYKSASGGAARPTPQVGAAEEQADEQLFAAPAATRSGRAAKASRARKNGRGYVCQANLGTVAHTLPHSAPTSKQAGHRFFAAGDRSGRGGRATAAPQRRGLMLKGGRPASPSRARPVRRPSVNWLSTLGAVE